MLCGNGQFCLSEYVYVYVHVCSVCECIHDCVVLLIRLARLLPIVKWNRSLMEVISTVPEMDPAKFESLINSSMQVYALFVVTGMHLIECNSSASFMSF